jgi:hypothetical protein
MKGLQGYDDEGVPLTAGGEKITSSKLFLKDKYNHE